MDSGQALAFHTSIDDEIRWVWQLCWVYSNGPVNIVGV